MSVMRNERRIELLGSRSSRKRKLSLIRRFCICFRLTSLPLGGDADTARHYFDVVTVQLLLRHANGCLCRHAERKSACRLVCRSPRPTPPPSYPKMPSLARLAAPLGFA